MTGSTGTWSGRLIAAGCVVVLGVGIGAAADKSGSGTKTPKAQSAVTPPVASPSTPSSPASPAASPHSSVPPTTPTSTAPSAPPASGTPRPAAPPASPQPTASTSASAGSTTRIPPGVLGTFTYQTTGYEQTSIPGTKRTYPSTTTITNTAQGCGVENTWKPVPQHVQSQLFCPDGTSLKLKAYQTTISFFGVSTGENFTCSGNSYVYRPGATAGQVWTYQCKSADAVASQRAQVVGYSTMSVGGVSVRVLHVSVATTLTGASSGKSTEDYWIETAKPVLVKESGTVTATQQSVHYQESYSLTLSSLTPKA